MHFYGVTQSRQSGSTTLHCKVQKSFSWASQPGRVLPKNVGVEGWGRALLTAELTDHTIQSTTNFYSTKTLSLSFFFFCLFFVLFWVFCFVLVFRDRVSLYSPGCPGTHFVDQADLELRNLPASASRVLGLKVCTTKPSFYTFSPQNSLFFLMQLL
jgi:hypothetical protein